MKRSFILIISLSAHLLFAQQDYESWKKAQKKQVDEFRKEDQEKFGKFKDEQDSLFAEYLKKEWEAFEVSKGLVPDDKPKPVKVPETTPKEIPEEMIPEPSKKIQTIYTPEEGVIQAAESGTIDVLEKDGEGEVLEFAFFDVNLRVNYDTTMLVPSLEKVIDQRQISHYWVYLSRSKYEILLKQVEDLKEQMRLNDWGYCILLKNIGDELYKGSDNLSRLFVWYMLVKTGYDAKVGYLKDEVFLLLPSIHMMYRIPYFIMDDKKYYVVTFNPDRTEIGSVYTYEGGYPEATQLISMNIHYPPTIDQHVEGKDLRFCYGDETYSFDINLKKDVVDFFHDYPQTEYWIYFNASLSPETWVALAQQLKPIIEKRSEVDGVNMLLRFVQTAFSYRIDEEQFGYEKPFFADETLFYPYSDCEDRSVLFAFLVRNLLKLDVIGLDYPAHMAAAVRFNTEVKGDFIEYEEDKYIICDPTYKNANIGQCMPEFKDVIPEVIEIVGSREEHEENAKY